MQGQGKVKASKCKERLRQSQGEVKVMQAQPQLQLQFDGVWHNWKEPSCSILSYLANIVIYFQIFLDIVEWSFFLLGTYSNI